MTGVDPGAVSRERHLEHLQLAGDTFADVLASTSAGAATPTCPGWTLADLTGHLGGVHRWARAALSSSTPPPESDETPPDDALLDWFTAGHADLVAALTATDSATPCWGFGPPPRTAAFWVRRQAHETAMHAVDALAARALVDGEPEPLDVAHLLDVATVLPPDIAADAVDEVVTVMTPRQVRLQRIAPLEGALELVATDVGRTWWLGDGAPVAQLSASSLVLALLLWRRQGLTDVRVQGDRSAVDAALAVALTP